MTRIRPRALVTLGLALLLAGCFPILPSQGGGQTSFEPPRRVDPADVATLPGFVVEVVATDLTFPTGVAFGDDGEIYVTESGYAYGEVFTTPRLLRFEPNGERSVLLTGANPPWNGVAYANGSVFLAEGGVLEGGRILRVDPDGSVAVLAEGLPSFGDHHTNGPVVHGDHVYFGQGTVTNSGVVGTDSADFGWLARRPDVHDVPCEDVTLAGQDFVTSNPLANEPATVRTGAFVPFGTPTEPGQVVPGRVPCSGAILRVGVGGGPVELVAWGFRNPFGLAVENDGTLWVTDNMYDDRGSRPVFGAGDVLWRVEPGRWYGWPEAHAGRLVTDGDDYRAPGRPTPTPVLAALPGEPERPAAILGVHSSSNGFDISRSASFGFEGQAFVAQWGDLAPEVGKVLAPVGYKIVRVDTATGVSHDFAINRDPSGPASRTGLAGLERPVAARFDPAGDALYVVDFGVVLVTEAGPVPVPGTGVLWRITRGDAR